MQHNLQISLDQGIDTTITLPWTHPTRLLGDVTATTLTARDTKTGASWLDVDDLFVLGTETVDLEFSADVSNEIAIADDAMVLDFNIIMSFADADVLAFAGLLTIRANPATAQIGSPLAPADADNPYPKLVKSPTDDVPFLFDWTKWIRPANDPELAIDGIAHGTITSTAAGLTIATATITATTVRALISGGTVGVDYPIVCEVNTILGLTASAERILSIVENAR